MKLMRPHSVDEAAAVMAAAAQPIAYAGGIEVLLGLRSGALEADVLVDTKRIEGSAAIETAGTMIRIGPAARHHDVASDPLVADRLPLLARACSQLGTVRIRMQGTLGGNLAAGLSHTDPGAAVLVYGGRITLVDSSGRRRVPLAEFWNGTGTVVRMPGELIESIELEPLDADWLVTHERVESRHRPPSAVLSCAMRIVDGHIAQCRLAAGAVGDRPRRLGRIEAVLSGCRSAEIGAVVAEHRALIGEEACARSNRAGSAGHKTDLLAGLIQRAVVRLAAEARKVPA
ncbi:MAG TPA: FAD binding domain-containing protein [Micromonosporaceae bacterium]